MIRTPAHLDGHARGLGEVPERDAEQADECGLGLIRLRAAGTQDAPTYNRVEMCLSILIPLFRKQYHYPPVEIYLKCSKNSHVSNSYKESST